MSSLSPLPALLMALLCTFASAHVADMGKGSDNHIEPNVVTPRRTLLHDTAHIKTMSPETVQLEPGTRLVLECEVFGSPTPSVQWMKNGDPVMDNNLANNDIPPADSSVFAEVYSKLIVTSANNGDVFTCVASSALYRRSLSTTVFTVEGTGSEEGNFLKLQKLFRVPTIPVITFYYSGIFQDSGTNIVLPCRVDSTSRSQVYWRNNRDDLVIGNSRMRVLPSGDLLISPLLWADMGNFICIAKNMYGKDVQETFIYPVKPSNK